MAASVVYSNYLTEENWKLLVCGYIRLNFSSYKPPSEIIDLCIIWHGTKQWLSIFENNKCKVGIIGLPNAGKTSLFNLLSGMNSPAENYPFCTIMPTNAHVQVPDKRFDDLCQAFDAKSRVPSTMNIYDIAGIIKGAHEGCGLGNHFLHHIESVDALFHVIRAFKDKHVEHVEDSVDPIRDIKIMANELRQKDKAILIEKQIKKQTLYNVSNNDDKLKDELECIRTLFFILDENKDIQYARQYPEKWVDYIKSYNLFTCKPIIFLINVSEQNWLNGKHSQYMKQIKEFVDKQYHGAIVQPFCASFEKRLNEMSHKEMQEYIIKNKTKSAKKEIIDSVMISLHLINYFSCSNDEVRSWMIRNGTKAPQAAGLIHCDFETGFISVQTYSYKDFQTFGKTKDGVKNAGKYYTNKQNYIVKDGDILSLYTI